MSTKRVLILLAAIGCMVVVAFAQEVNELWDTVFAWPSGADITIALEADAANDKAIEFRNDAVKRLRLNLTNLDWTIDTYDSNGDYVDTPLTIPNTGAITMGGSTKRDLDLTGDLTINSLATGVAVLAIDGGVNEEKFIEIREGGVKRYGWTAESGQLVLSRYDAAGALWDDVLSIEEAQYGYVTFTPQTYFTNGIFANNDLITAGASLHMIGMESATDIAYIRAEVHSVEASEAARISFIVDGTTGTGDYPGKIVFSTTTDGTATLTPRTTIHQDGLLSHAYDAEVLGALAVGGGYGSTGVTISSAGAISADSNVTYKGILRSGSGGINKDWSVMLLANDRDIFDRDSSPPAAAALYTIQAARVRVWGKAFDAATAEYTMAYLPMPLDYNGAQLKVTLHWTAIAGTTGNVFWAVIGRCFANDGTLADATSGATAGSLVDGFIAQNDLHIVQATLTPNNFTASPCMLMLTIFRYSADGADTFDADAILTAVELSYA